MDIFLIWIGRMSFQAAAAVLAVYAVRLLFDRMKLPRRYDCFLWIIPYLVMILPWKLKSPFGLWRGTQAEYIPVNMPDKRIFVEEGAYLVSDYHEPVLWGHMTAQARTDISFAAVLLGIWLAGIGVLLVRSLISYYRLQKQLVCRVHIRENIYMADDIDMPFVLGVRSPEIFLPSSMEKALLPYVIEHEKMHIRRGDPLVKTAAFLITCIHWFNPAVWAALYGLEQDMEMACDEGAVRTLGREKIHAYASALVKAAAEPGILSGTFLAFGEGSVKKRIKNILENKRPWKMAAVLGAVAVFVLGAGFLTEAKELPKPQYIVDVLEKVLPKQMIRNAAAETAEPKASEGSKAWHREGYAEVKLHEYVPQSAKSSGYVTEGRRSEEENEMLAQSAMRELYDLTGTQIEECYYFTYDHGYFVFALTEDDLEHGRAFYYRQFENENIIQSIDMASARRVWYSPVDMWVLPEGYETMTEADRAGWFVEHSGLYNGKKIDSIYQPYDWDLNIWRVVMEDDTAYEIFMDSEVDSFSNIAGPYPNSDIQH